MLPTARSAFLPLLRLLPPACRDTRAPHTLFPPAHSLIVSSSRQGLPCIPNLPAPHSSPRAPAHGEHPFLPPFQPIFFHPPSLASWSILCPDPAHCPMRSHVPQLSRSSLARLSPLANLLSISRAVPTPYHLQHTPDEQGRECRQGGAARRAGRSPACSPHGAAAAGSAHEAAPYPILFLSPSHSQPSHSQPASETASPLLPRPLRFHTLNSPNPASAGAERAGGRAAQSPPGQPQQARCRGAVGRYLTSAAAHRSPPCPSPLPPSAGPPSMAQHAAGHPWPRAAPAQRQLDAAGHRSFPAASQRGHGLGQLTAGGDGRLSRRHPSTGADTQHQPSS